MHDQFGCMCYKLLDIQIAGSEVFGVVVVILSTLRPVRSACTPPTSYPIPVDIIHYLVYRRYNKMENSIIQAFTDRTVVFVTQIIS